MSIVTEEKGETSPMRRYQIPSAEARAPELRSLFDEYRRNGRRRGFNP